MFPTKARYYMSRIKREPARMILLFLVLSRKTDYYNFAKTKGGVMNKLLYLFYISSKNRLGEKLGLEIGTENTDKGLMIYHFNNVVHGGSIIGENLRLHGNNCIGNDGKTNDCPIIGNDVSLGVGAKVIGKVTIANNIRIAAGAVVVHSFLEEGITIGGVPARKLR
jgi:serine O-acetyltransferase